MERLPKMISVSEKIYRQLLHLYPQAHRRDYAEQMAQLFRDQCRDAWRAKRSAGVLKLWLRVLPDIAKTSVIEQFNERNQIMKYFNAKSTPTISTVVALALGFLSFNFLTVPNVWSALATMAFVAIFAKAIAELFRPSNECGRIFLRTLLVMFCFAIFMPAWAKAASAGRFEVGFDANFNEPFVYYRYMMTSFLFANPIVAVFKLLQFLIQRRKS
jgi:hypothetical protein